MALFGKKKQKTKAQDAPVKEEAATRDASKKTKKDAPENLNERDLSSVIARPRITEKAANVGEQNVYTFEVRRDATKYDVRSAVQQLFKVTPRKINIVNQKPRAFHSRMRNRHGVHPGMKKAYVYLKKDDRIDLV